MKISFFKQTSRIIKKAATTVTIERITITQIMMRFLIKADSSSSGRLTSSLMQYRTVPKHKIIRMISRMKYVFFSANV